MPNSRFEIFDILTAEGRRADSLWLKEGKIYDWNLYKQIALTSRGSVVLHERFQPDFPDGNTWALYLTSDTDGEPGHRVDSVPADSTLERLDLAYVYEDGSLLAATYDGKGRLTSIQAQQHLLSSFYRLSPSVFNPFAAYGLPTAISPQIDQPPINDELRGGLAKATSAPFKNAPLEAAFVVRQYELGRLYQITRQSAKDHGSDSQVLRFAKRPYDKQIREAAVRDLIGRPRDIRRPRPQDRADQPEPSFPEVPLVIGGTRVTGGNRLTHVSVHGSPRIVRAEDPELTLAHIRIEFDRNARVQLVGSSSPGGRYVWTTDYSYMVDGVPMGVTVTVDGRAKTLTVGDSSFQLARGNFVRIMISPDLEVTAEQIAIVKLSGAYDSERMVKIFESHIQNR